MASGKSLLTYIGDEDTGQIENTVFTKGEPQLIHDNGIIGAAELRDDFTVGPVVDDSAPDEDAQPAAVEAPAAPAKPKTARKPRKKAA